MLGLRVPVGRRLSLLLLLALALLLNAAAAYGEVVITTTPNASAGASLLIAHGSNYLTELHVVAPDNAPVKVPRYQGSAVGCANCDITIEAGRSAIFTTEPGHPRCKDETTCSETSIYSFEVLGDDGPFFSVDPPAGAARAWSVLRFNDGFTRATFSLTQGLVALRDLHTTARFGALRNSPGHRAYLTILNGSVEFGVYATLSKPSGNEILHLDAGEVRQWLITPHFDVGDITVQLGCSSGSAGTAGCFAPVMAPVYVIVTQDQPDGATVDVPAIVTP